MHLLMFPKQLLCGRYVVDSYCSLTINRPKVILLKKKLNSIQKNSAKCNMVLQIQTFTIVR